MSRNWKDMAELGAAIRERAAAGKQVVLSPETALRVAATLAPASRRPVNGFIDPFSEGSSVYRVNEQNDILELVAFARSALVARAAFDHLCERYPNESYSQRRRAWVEADRIVAVGK